MLPKGAQRAEGPQKAGEGLLEVTAGFGQTEHRRTDPFQAGDTTSAKRKMPEPVAGSGLPEVWEIVEGT